jgi:hypothetical protein
MTMTRKEMLTARAEQIRMYVTMSGQAKDNPKTYIEHWGKKPLEVVMGKLVAEATMAAAFAGRLDFGAELFQEAASMLQSASDIEGAVLLMEEEGSDVDNGDVEKGDGENEEKEITPAPYIEKTNQISGYV